MLKGEVIRFEANQDDYKKSYKLYLNMRYEEKIMNEWNSKKNINLESIIFRDLNYHFYSKQRN